MCRSWRRSNDKLCADARLRTGDALTTDRAFVQARMQLSENYFGTWPRHFVRTLTKEKIIYEKSKHYIHSNHFPNAWLLCALACNASGITTTIAWHSERKRR